MVQILVHLRFRIGSWVCNSRTKPLNMEIYHHQRYSHLRWFDSSNHITHGALFSPSLLQHGILLGTQFRHVFQQTSLTADFTAQRFTPSKEGKLLAESRFVFDQGARDHNWLALNWNTQLFLGYFIEIMNKIWFDEMALNQATIKNGLVKIVSSKDHV